MGVVLNYYADLEQKGECNQWPLYALCYGRFMLYVTAWWASLCVTAGGFMGKTTVIKGGDITVGDDVHLVRGRAGAESAAAAVFADSPTHD